ncbi:MAG: aldo/keto reductase [Candidatus Sumerlaeota bacterium]|nr:aldo/keto reductase [Candidatus Sumerlaeota bacterium]
MTNWHATRREFMKATSAAALGASMAPLEALGSAAPKAEAAKILNYNPDMEYRRCGKTGWMVSAVCVGGHWKRLDVVAPGVFPGSSYLKANLDDPSFQKNRRDVLTRAMERGINYVDACAYPEIKAYSKALEGRRDQMHLGWSYYEHEARKEQYRTAEALLQTLDDGMKECKQDYVDLWRITCIATPKKGTAGLAHNEAESEQIAKALAGAKKAGKARATGISSHDRKWIEYMMTTFPDEIEVVVTPYTANTKALPTESFFDTVKKCDCGFFGIKPFASNSLFKGDSSPQSPTREEDDRLARLAIRYILCNPAITAPIPGLISPDQVDNVALAAKERRELDGAEAAELHQAMTVAWANLDADHQWLRDWEYV